MFEKENNLSKKEYYILYILVFCILLIHTLGVFRGFFSDDAGLYALISKNIYISQNWADLKVYDKDWLDKPHFQFWVTAFSFKIFGVNSFAYKIPSLIFFFIGVYYTYRLGVVFKNKLFGIIGILILITTQHIFISNEDIRAETMLIGLIVPSLYYLIKLIDKTSLKSIILASLFSACAMMTKGLVVLIPACSGILCYYLLTKNYRELIHYKWWIFLLLTFLFLTPEFYSLYLQFDSQPEKVVFDQVNVSGIKWFLWDSQFGRFLGEGPISRPKRHVWEYWMGLFWTMAPWFVPFIGAVFLFVKGLINTEKYPKGVIVLVFGTLGTMIIFSFSSFQLPHYSNIIYPFASVIIAYFIFELLQKKWIKVYNGISVLLLLLIMLGATYLDWKVAIILLGFILVSVMLYRMDGHRSLKPFFALIIFMACLNLIVSLFVYPILIEQKPEQEIAEYLNENYKDEKAQLFSVEKISHRFDFYYDQQINEMIMMKDITKEDKSRLALIQDQWVEHFLWDGNRLDTLKSWEYLPQENISLMSKYTGKEPKKRTWYLLRINP